MRKLILLGLMAAVAVPSVSHPQSSGGIRRDGQEVREQREDLRDARERGIGTTSASIAKTRAERGRNCARTETATEVDREP